jgi:hypothetical protein
MKKIAAFVMLTFIWSDASAWWWLLRGATARGATAGTVARGAAAAGGGTAAEAASALSYSRSAAGAARFCVRPVNAAACDLRNASSAAEAVQSAVGGGHRVRSTNRPSIFEVLDAAGNFVGLVEAVDRTSDSEVAQLPQYANEQPTIPIFVHNKYPQSIFIRARGENCDFSEFRVEGQSRMDISCSNSNTYFVEIYTTDPRTGERYEVRQRLSAGGHYGLVLDGQYSSRWHLVQIPPN